MSRFSKLSRILWHCQYRLTWVPVNWTQKSASLFALNIDQPIQSEYFTTFYLSTVHPGLLWPNLFVTEKSHVFIHTSKASRTRTEREKLPDTP